MGRPSNSAPIRLAHAVFLAVCAGVTAATLFALNTEHVALLETQRSLNAEHANNERRHNASQADRDSIRATQGAISRLLDEIVAEKRAAIH